jgi:long-chain fatty acid transport protein
MREEYGLDFLKSEHEEDGRMRKGYIILGVVGLVCFLTVTASPLYAGGIINKNNQSADYIRTLNRSAATDYPDIAVYNPAGIMKMDNGAYGKIDVLYFNKDYSNDVPGFGRLNADTPSIIPGAFALFKRDRWAGFFAFTIPAGGGELNYKDGNARTVALSQGVAFNANQLLAPGIGAGLLPPTAAYSQIDAMEIEVKQSSVLGFTFGGSFALNDMFSFAAGVRYSTGTREFDGQTTISAVTTIPGVNEPLNPSLRLEEDASGWAGILGANFAWKDLNAAVTFISNTKMDYKMDVRRDSLGIAPALGFADGSRRRIDIPGQLGLGVSYKFLPQLKVDLNYVLYLESSASIDTFEDEGNSWDLGLTGEYTFSPKWKASLGYLYTKIKLDDAQQINEPEEPKLSANTLGGGFVFSPTPSWDITFGGLYVWYQSVTGVSEDPTQLFGVPVEYDKKVWNLSAGVTWKFF